jgi:PST family polysaccharide transporter
MNPLLRAAAILGSSSLASVAAGLAAAKLYAVLVGPAGVGRIGLVQSIQGLGVLVCGCGLGAAVVHFGARAHAEGGEARWQLLSAAAARFAWILGGLGAAIAALARHPIGASALGDAARAGDVVLAGAALAFNLACDVDVSLLNARQRLRALAAAGILRSVLGAAASVAVVATLGIEGAAAAVLAGAAAGWAAVRILRGRILAGTSAPASWRETGRCAAELLRYGAPLSASRLAASGVPYLLPILVLHALGPEEVGLYRAAAAISVHYLGFLLAALAQDYFPRLSAVRDDPDALRGMVQAQMRVVFLLGMPVLLLALAAAPFLVPLLYSDAFAPAAPLLAALLVGDVPRFAAWTLGYLLMATASNRLYLALQLFTGANVLGLSWLGLQAFGLVGLGVGSSLAYAVHLAAAAWLARRSIGALWTVELRRLLGVAAAAAAAMAWLQLQIPGRAAAAVNLAIAVCLGAALFRRLLRDEAGAGGANPSPQAARTT